MAERYVQWIAGGAGQWPLHRATEALRRRAQRLVAREEGVIVDVAHALIWRETVLQNLPVYPEGYLVFGSCFTESSFT